jgi:hypothetical protein
LGIESPVPGQSSEFSGAYRFERPIDACELAPGLENTPQRRVSLESNERNFLSLVFVLDTFMRNSLTILSLRNILKLRLSHDIIIFNEHEYAEEVELKQPQGGGLEEQRSESDPKEGYR